MRTSPLTLVAALLVLVALVAGCGGQDVGFAPGEGEGEAGPDGEWELVDGVPTVDGYPITLRVDGDEVGGTAACNSYGGDARITDDQLVVGDIARTEMGCPEPGVHDSESAYLDALQAVERWELDGEQLILEGPDVRLTFDPVAEEPDAPLVGTRWALESVIEGAGPDGSVSSAMAPAWLVLDGDGSLSGSDGCNDLGGSYELDGDVLLTRDLASTRMACPEVQAQADRVLEVLESDPTFEVDGPRLSLRTADGRGIDYRAE